MRQLFDPPSLFFGGDFEDELSGLDFESEPFDPESFDSELLDSEVFDSEPFDSELDSFFDSAAAAFERELLLSVE
jgi:hypothetical protein